MSSFCGNKFLACLASGILVPLPFLFPVLSPVGWFSFVPLLRAVHRSQSVWEALFAGWLAGTVATLIGFYWLDYTIRVFGGIPYGASEFLFLLFSIYSAFPFAFFSFAVRLVGFGPLDLFPALIWVAAEFLFPQLFPWHLVNSQSYFLTFIQSADLVGPYGGSFLLMWLNTLFFSSVFAPPEEAKKLRRAAAVLGALVVATLFYGHMRLRTIDAAMLRAPKLSVAAVQGNIDIDLKWDPDRLEDNLRSYQDLTEHARATLVIWPETAVELWLPESLKKLPPEILPSLDSSFFVFGARTFRGEPAKPDFQAFNSALLTDARGAVLGRYHKQVLLAFGEYLPFAAVLSRLPGVPPIESFTEGEGPLTFDLPSGARIAPLICYEDLMPRLARSFVRQKGANVLVNLTNDAWYGRTVAPWQHAWLARWRAIETRRALVRVTNTGLTAVINPKGEVARSLPTFTPGILTENVEVMEGETLYVRFGDWFAWLITGAALAILLWHIRSQISD